ncbi:serine/threonine-protein phosphatase 2A 55 kDa regulatory subunit B beta isoform isoform X1 [Lates japonicus]|uniref:Serine/threonine-protein phosphatase 2A 55 kDa regulatory subunit B beta isoform isoform X1 n=1 Tax=Lates japonicus TaxID=270547 RepID=A0AAD3MCW2_LATJO|nr:serine/threonine-protein phosphatase 2A 55 kDa regulatory subunit B beta isoform isoform X1 [Lates japonicus]
MTGAYNNFFRMFDRTPNATRTLRHQEQQTPAALKPLEGLALSREAPKDAYQRGQPDFTKKIPHAWHPTEKHHRHRRHQQPVHLPDKLQL